MLSLLSSQRRHSLVGERWWVGMDWTVGVRERSSVTEQSMYGERSGIIGFGVWEQCDVESSVELYVGVFREQECLRAGV